MALCAMIIAGITTGCKKPEVSSTHQEQATAENAGNKKVTAVTLNIPGFPNGASSPGASITTNTGGVTISHLTISDDYTVQVRPVGGTYQYAPTYKTDNYAPLPATNSGRRTQTSASFSNFCFSGGSVEVLVTARKKASIGSFKIRPLSYGITAVKSGNTLTFTLEQSRKISVEIDDRNNPLFIFGNPPEPPLENAVVGSGGVTHTYNPGTVTNIGFRKPIHSNDRINIRAGAVVQGTFAIDKGATNVKFIGEGIVTSGNTVWTSNDQYDLANKSTFAGTAYTNGVSGVTWQGLTIVNAAAWVFQCVAGYDSHESSGNVWKDLKEIHWNPNTDVIWFDGDNNTLSDLFLFANDDISTHGSNNCTLTNVVYWQGRNGGHVFIQNAYSSSNTITYDNFNIIGVDNCVEMVKLYNDTNHSGIVMNNITFKNFKVEETRSATSSYFKNRIATLYPNSGYSASALRFQNWGLSTLNADEGSFTPNAASSVTLDHLFFPGFTASTSANAHMTFNSNVNYTFLSN